MQFYYYFIIFSIITAKTKQKKLLMMSQVNTVLIVSIKEQKIQINNLPTSNINIIIFWNIF